MSIHILEATVDQNGRIVLNHVPFVPGERVDVVLRPHAERPHQSGTVDLRGSVIRFENPLDPVAEEDWEIRH